MRPFCPKTLGQTATSEADDVLVVDVNPAQPYPQATLEGLGV